MIGLRYEALILLRSPGQLGLIGAVFLGGLLSIWMGTTIHAVQTENVSQLEQHQEASLHHARTFSEKPPNTGYAAYLAQLPTANAPTALAALALGGRDYWPYDSELRTLAVDNQIDNQALVNPLRSYAGSFDLTFVLAVFLPLALIALCSSVASRERESGRELMFWQDRRLVRRRLWVRHAVLLAVAFLLLVLAGVWSGASLLTLVGVWFPVIVVHQTFWLMVIRWVCRETNSTEFNAAAAVSLWALLTYLVPGVGDAAISSFYPAKQGPELVMEHRHHLNGAWDRPRGEALSEFRGRHASFANVDVTEEKFTWA
ncbi:MAG: hypothetical protein AAFQ82_28475, partial [Myxococcota bacterium]